MKRAYFVRHGLTQENEIHVYQLPTIPLSDKGKAHVHQMTDIGAALGSERGYGQKRYEGVL
jgi:broad specificity phosphatase PhoE